MLYWGQLDPEMLYVIDLMQWPDGTRGVRFRTPEARPHEHAVLQSKVYSGARLQRFGRERFCSTDIQTADGRSFGLDPHDIWMTQEEAEYWRANHSQAALDSPQAPWVNHLPPQLPPS